MTRKLPWKRGVATRQPLAAGTSAAGSPFSTARGTPVSPAAASDDFGQTSAARPGQQLRARARSPSTSPPPAPPVESFMIDGFEADDGFRMVEDEFLSVAGTFTAHLHKAEYHRLKNLAKDRNAETIQNISRPVTGDKTVSVDRRYAVKRLAARQRAAIKRARGENAAHQHERGDGDGDGDDDSDAIDNPWEGTALQGLMDSPRRRAIPLSGLLRNAAQRGAAADTPSARRRGSPSPRTLPRSNTTPITRNVIEPTTDSEDDDDDLDAPFCHIAKEQHSAVCQRRGPTPGSESEDQHDVASDSRSASRQLAVASCKSRTMHKGGPAPRGSAGAAHNSHAPSAGFPGVSDGDNGNDSDDSGILRRIRDRKRRHGTERLQEGRLEQREDDRDLPAVRVKEESQGASLDFVPSFL